MLVSAASQRTERTSHRLLYTMPDTGILLPAQNNPEGPVRILVQTKTHLVPGTGRVFAERCLLMKNLICQQHWNRNFDPKQDRLRTQGTNFAYEGRRCYFLVDHGRSESDDIPVVWYKWNGKDLYDIHPSERCQCLPSGSELVEYPLPVQLLSKLKSYPFSPQQRGHSPALTSTQLDDAKRRQIIRSRLRSEMAIPKSDVEFLTNPDQVQQLKAITDPNLWPRIDALVNA